MTTIWVCVSWKGVFWGIVVGKRSRLHSSGGTDLPERSLYCKPGKRMMSARKMQKVAVPTGQTPRAFCFEINCTELKAHSNA